MLNLTLNLAFFRLGMASLALAAPLLQGHSLQTLMHTPVLLGFWVFAVACLAFAVRAARKQSAESKHVGFIDAAMLGAGLATTESPILLAGLPLLMVLSVWSLPRPKQPQVISQFLLAAVISWVASAWYLPPGLQVLAWAYVGIGVLYAVQWRMRQRTVEEEGLSSSSLPEQLAGLVDSAPSTPITEAPPPTQAKRKILLLEGQARDSRQLVELLEGWEEAVEVTTDLGSMVAAAYRAEHIYSDDVIIFDQRGRTEDPLQFGHLFKSSRLLANLKLILICSPPVDNDLHDLLATTYDVVLDAPTLDKTLLFNALKSARPTPPSTGVALLLDQYLRVSSPIPSLQVLLALPASSQQQVNRRALEREGHQIYGTDSGEQALDALSMQQFDIALVHFELPDMDAIELTRIHCLTQLSTYSTPIVVVGNHITQEMHQRCIQAGARGTLNLPLQLTEFRDLHDKLQRVNGNLNRSSLEDADRHPDLSIRQLNYDTLRDLECLGSELSFLQDLIDAFCKDSDQSLQDAIEAIKSSNLRAFKDAANALRGGAGSVGAARLQHYCGSLIKASAEDLFLHGDSLSNRLRQSVHEAQNALLSYVQKRQEQVGVD